MNRLLAISPVLLTLAACAGLVLHGPIAQPLQYHEFADQSLLLGMPHAADVISNLGFALVALWGVVRMRPHAGHALIVRGWPGYRLFLIGLMLTAVGSGFYHLAPDNWRLVWDRLPIALACAGLIAAVRGETKQAINAEAEAVWLGLFAVASVAWWAVTDDLRPYLLLQFLPIVLIPLWQLAAGSPRRDRIAFGVALLLYVAAKAAELHDHQLLAAFGIVSGHTLKHLLATLAAGVLVGRLVQRVHESGMPVSRSNPLPNAVIACKSVDLA